MKIQQKKLSEIFIKRMFYGKLNLILMFRDGSRFTKMLKKRNIFFIFFKGFDFYIFMTK